MPKYRDDLPQLKGGLFITDAGLETVLIFHHNIELPLFAAFPLVNDNEGYTRLYDYFSTYAKLAVEHNTGLILESFTWRASADWGAQLGYSSESLAEANHRAIDLLSKVRDSYENEKSPMVISGCIGPRGDGYNPTEMMSEDEAYDYHRVQIETLTATKADMVSALTMNYLPEALGIVRAAKDFAIPVVVSFTVETDGTLPSGQPLKEAIIELDERTKNAPAYYMLNCAHPTHFSKTLYTDEPWVKRIRGLKSNASTMSHVELDEAEELDDGNPKEFGLQYKELLEKLDQVNVVGGCCGTDRRHIEAICDSCIS